MTITGTRGNPVPSANGTVLLAFNTAAGLRITPAAFGSGGTDGLNDINGLVAWGNTNRDMSVLGGSEFRLRNSVFGWARRASVSPTTAATPIPATTSRRSTSAVRAAPATTTSRCRTDRLGFNTSAGICLVLRANHPAQNLFVAGNFMTTTGNPGMQLDCSMSVRNGHEGHQLQRQRPLEHRQATPVDHADHDVLTMCN